MNYKRLSPLAIEFVRGLLTVEVNARFTAEMALKHEWLTTHVNCDIDLQMYSNLINYTTFSTLKRITMEVIAFSLSHEEIKNLIDTMDANQNGYVTFGELKKHINKSFKISDEELKRVFDALDENHTGKVHLNEFIAGAMELKYQLDEKLLKQAFQVMDHENTGYITVNDLKLLLGKHVDENRVLEIIKIADYQHNGKISFQDFLNFVKEFYL